LVAATTPSTDSVQRRCGVTGPAPPSPTMSGTNRTSRGDVATDAVNASEWRRCRWQARPPSGRVGALGAGRAWLSARHPAAGGCAITMSRTPYRGRTPEARATVGAGIPGTPGIPDPAASSVPASVVKPAGDNAETARPDGADQLAGTDNGPIEFARATLASTALGRPAPPPRPDAAPADCCSAGSAGATSAATVDKSGRRPKFAGSIPQRSDVNMLRSIMRFSELICPVRRTS